MKWKKLKVIENEGIIQVINIVNKHGSIFRSIHQESDIGIDGTIELVTDENSTGKLLAVQIKSGDTYLSKKKTEFEITVDKKHLDYWMNYMLPVILICYSPTKNILCWISIREYIEHQNYHGQIKINKIIVPFYCKFDKDCLNNEIIGLADMYYDEKLLLICADKCLSDNSQERHDGFSMLSGHPKAHDLKILYFIAKKLILDDNIDTAKKAMYFLGYGVARSRWSWNPNNENEKEIMYYAQKLCGELTKKEIQRLIELTVGEYFNGPEGLGERCFDILGCSYKKAIDVLEELIRDTTVKIETRENALYLLYNCDEDEIIKSKEKIFKDSLGEVYNSLFQIK